MWAPKITHFLVGVISSVLLMIYFTFPFSHDFVTTTILVPPYPFVTVNFIIFVIWILSEHHHHHQSIDRKHNRQRESSIELSSVVPKTQTQVSFFPETQLQFPSLPKLETKSDLSCVSTDDEVTSPPAVVASPTIRKQNAVVKRISNPKPPRSTVEEEEVEKSMDATWETIITASSAGRQFKKRETWKVPKEVEKVKSPKVVGRAEMRKPETFNKPCRQRVPISRKDEVVVENDELNRQFDDFIQKTNDYLRLQRQESHQRYIRMVNRGMTPELQPSCVSIGKGD